MRPNKLKCTQERNPRRYSLKFLISTTNRNVSLLIVSKYYQLHCCHLPDQGVSTRMESGDAILGYSTDRPIRCRVLFDIKTVKIPRNDKIL